MGSNTGNFGSNITVPASDFDRFSYLFDGWSTEADGSGDAYQEGDTLATPAEDITLYAQWEPIEISLKDSGTGVQVTAPKETFNQWVNLVVTPSNAKVAKHHTIAYNISFINEKGGKVKPNKAVTVTIPIESLKETGLTVFHNLGGDTWEEISLTVVTREGGKRVTSFTNEQSPIYAAATPIPKQR